MAATSDRPGSHPRRAAVASRPWCHFFPFPVRASFMRAISQGMPCALRQAGWLVLVALAALPLSACSGSKDKDKFVIAAQEPGRARARDWDGGKDKDKG